ncbi:MAG: ABC transporter permease [Phaeodactylibacter sp.]|nr:ABC transporter permease [Phaeodactylibacter sp.]
MLHNYFKIALRNIWKNKLYFGINVMGLGIALACSVIAYLNYAFDQSFDAFHQKRDRICRVNMIRQSNGVEYGLAPLPLGPAAAQDIPGIRSCVRVEYQQAAVKRGETVLSESIQYTDSGFFQLFGFSLRAGSYEALSDRNKVLISEPVAKRYFGEENPIGKELVLHPGEPFQQILVVGAVLEERPMNSGIDYDLITHFDNLQVNGQKQAPDDWSFLTALTFFELEGTRPPAAIAGELNDKYLGLHNQHIDRLKASSYVLEPFADSAHRAARGEVRGNYLRQSLPVSAVWGPILLAVLLLLTACLNFTNTAISAAGRRLREMGIRKVMGGTRQQLIGQLLGENFLVSLLALLVGLGLVEVLLPPYNRMWPYLYLEANYLSDGPLLAFLAFILVVTALLGGAYPAFYISGFRPSAILRGKLRFGGSNLFTRILMGVQVMIALMAVLTGLSFARNAAFQENMDRGYNRHGLLGCRLDNAAEFNRLEQALQRNPKVEKMAGAANHLGYSLRGKDLEARGEKYDILYMGVGKDYLEMMDIKMAEGRSFREELESDNRAMLVNERLVLEFGWEQPIGQQVVMDSATYTVVGIVRDFVQQSAFNPVAPLALTRVEPEDYQFLMVRARAENLLALEKELRAEWARLFPLKAYRGFFQDEILAEEVVVSNNIKWMLLFQALVTILLSMTGLFAMVSLNVLKRLKEIAIRRIVGAQARHIAYLINKNYLWIFAVAAILGTVGGAFLSWKLMDSIFAIHAGLHSGLMAGAALGVVLLTVGTISLKVWGVLRVNPAEILRKE